MDELQAGAFDFDLQVQLCIDLEAMPVNNTTVEWPERLSPFVTVGRVHIPRQDISGTDTPYWNRGKHLREIRGKHGAPFGETIMHNATEGTIKETSYWWPRPGSDQPFEKRVFYTKVNDQICAVGYYEE